MCSGAMEVTKQSLDVFKCEGTLTGSDIKPRPKSLMLGKDDTSLDMDETLKASTKSQCVALRTLDIFAGMFFRLY